MPNPEHLKAIRQEIDYNFSEFKAILNEKPFSKDFDKLSEEDKLKTLPKGYSAENPAIEFLKLKSYIASTPISDKALLKPASSPLIVDMFESLVPFMEFLRSAIA